jgi:hypothetical protein
MKNKTIIILTILIAMGLASCNDSIINDPDQIVFPAKNVSYQNHIQPFMVLTCAYQGCHSDETMAGGRSMTNYIALFETMNMGLVIQGNPDASVLIQMLEGKLPHNPYVYWKVNDNHKTGIRQWILEGAMNN